MEVSHQRQHPLCNYIQAFKMFKKKPQIKPLAPIRSSDRRKTADSIIAAYDLKVPLAQDATAEEKATATTEQTSLRNSLLPDNIQSARFTTTHGPDLKQVSGTVYVGSHPGEDQRVLWFKIDEQMYPSGRTCSLLILRLQLTSYSLHIMASPRSPPAPSHSRHRSQETSRRRRPHDARSGRPAVS